MLTYEERLNRDRRWALQEGGWYFEKASLVHETLRRAAAIMDEGRVSYAVVGTLAMFFHGYRRFTENVDFLVSHEGLDVVRDRLRRLNYVPVDDVGKRWRDPDTGVRIQFLVTGGYPGDGKPKPVTFPDPASESVGIDDLRILSLPRLVELKLAAGRVGRQYHWCDAQELISRFRLPESFADQLDPSVQTKFREIWTLIRDHTDPHREGT